MAGIVVEGPDGSGKTTLLKTLRNELHWPVISVVQPGAPNVPQMHSLINCAPVLFDRFHLSPQVYGSVLRQGRELTGTAFDDLSLKLVRWKFFTIICLTDVTTMVENNHKEKQLFNAVREYHTMQDLDAEYRRIFWEIQRLGEEPIIYDYQKNAADVVGIIARAREALDA